MKVIGFTAGFYDIIHIGHINFLEEAKKKCDYLIVGVNCDALCLEHKNRLPVFSEEERMKIISSLKFVDEVILCESTNKLDYYPLIKYDVLIGASDKLSKESWKNYQKFMKNQNKKVEYISYTKNVSTSKIIEKCKLL